MDMHASNNQSEFLATAITEENSFSESKVIISEFTVDYFDYSQFIVSEFVIFELEDYVIEETV